MVKSGFEFVSKGEDGLGSAPFLTSNQQMGAFSSPVAYVTPLQFEAEFSNVLDNIEANLHLAGMIGADWVKTILLEVWRSASLNTKHPGFEEEQEWRVFYRPTLDTVHVARAEIETIGGVPQFVFKLKLENKPELGLVGLDYESLIKRIIIGPTTHGFVIREALISLLASNGVSKAAERVIESTIPLRSTY